MAQKTSRQAGGSTLTGTPGRTNFSFCRPHLGDSTRIVHGGATVFIPADTRISAKNIGTDVVSLAFVFSAPGFEEFMRAESVREGEKNTPLSKDEDDEIQRKHAHDVVYR